MTLTSARAATSNDDILELLASFQYLQGRNLRISKILADRFGMGETDLRALLVINHATQATPKSVARMVDHSTGAVTAMTDRLVASGHLERRAHPTDRRSSTLHLTELGSQIVEEVRSEYRVAFESTLASNQFRKAAEALRQLGTALETIAPVEAS